MEPSQMIARRSAILKETLSRIWRIVSKILFIISKSNNYFNL